MRTIFLLLPIVSIQKVIRAFLVAHYKEFPYNTGNTGNLGSTPGSGRAPGVGNGNPLQYPCLGNPMDRGAWRGTIHRWQRAGRTEHMCTHTESYHVDLLSKCFFNTSINILKCSYHGPLSCKINHLSLEFPRHIFVLIQTSHERLTRKTGNSSAAQCLKWEAWNQRIFKPKDPKTYSSLKNINTY